MAPSSGAFGISLMILGAIRAIGQFAIRGAIATDGEAARWRAERPYKQEPRSRCGRGSELGESNKCVVRSVAGPCGRSMAVAKREPRPKWRKGGGTREPSDVGELCYEG